MTIYGIHIIDHVVIAIYLLGITWLGLRMGKQVHNLESFFQGGRRFGRIFMMMFNFGAGTHSDHAVGVSSKTYTNGLSGIWYQWLWLFATPFYWWIAPIVRRMRALTNADYFEARYSKGFATFYCSVAAFIGVVTMATMLRGSGKIIEAVTDGQMPLTWAVGSMTLLFVIYGVAGGLAAAVMTDFIQGILTIVLSFLILPFAMMKVGGFSGLHESLTDPHMFSLVAPGDINTFYIVVISINSLFTIVGQAVIQAICGSGKTEYDSRWGFTFGTFIKRFCTIAWCFTGLCAVVLYPNLDDPDKAFGMAAYDLLPAIMPGLLGLLIASVLASVMSTCDVLMNATAGLLTNNVYRGYFAPHKSESHYVNFGRVMSVLTVAGGVVATFYLDSVIQGLEIFWQFSATMGIPWWLGVLWRRTNVAGAWASGLSALAVSILVTHSGFVEMLAPLMGSAVRYDEVTEIYSLPLPWKMVLYLVVGLVAGIVASLLTPRMNEERLNGFYDLLRTPVRPGEEIRNPCTLPEGSTPEQHPKLINHPDIELYRPTRVGLIGFFVAWAAVLGIIEFVKFLAGLGA